LAADLRKLFARFLKLIYWCALSSALMEILVDDTNGLSDSCIVSIRFGSTRRQAPLETVRTHPLKFPASQEACCEPLKIDVLQPVASARLVLHPNEACYRIGLDTKDGVEHPMDIGLRIGKDVSKIGNVNDRTPERNEANASPTKNYQDAAASAREYLETHGLLRYVQSLLHAVIQVRPEDPYQYMMHQLGAPRRDGAVRPTTPGPGAGAYRDAGPMYDFLGQGILPSEARAERSVESPMPPTSPYREAPISAPAPPSPPKVAPPSLPIKTRREPESAQAVDIRQRMKNMMQNAADTGVLDQVMDQVRQEQEAAVQRPQGASQDACTCGSVFVSDAVFCRKCGEKRAGTGESERRLARDGGFYTYAEFVEYYGQEWGASNWNEGAPDASSTRQAVVVVVSEEEANEAMRRKLRNLLEYNVDRGTLQEVIGARAPLVESPAIGAKAPLVKVEIDVESVRLQLRDVLEIAGDTGQLQQALHKAKAQTPKGADVDDTDGIRADLRNMLEGACDSGSLQDALGIAMSAKGNAEEVANVQVQFRSLLENACDSGALQDALDSALAKKTEVGAGEVESIQIQMRSMPESACDSGDFQQALDEALPKNNGGGAKDVENLRIEMRTMLESACDSGSLQQALDKAISKNESAGDRNVEGLRIEMKTLLESACDSGSLQQALDDAISKKAANNEVSDVEKTRIEMKGMPVEDLDSGSLQEAVDKTGNAKTVVKIADSRAAEIDRMRGEMRDTLESAVDSGALKSAMEEVKTAEGRDAEIDRMRGEMRDTLESAVDSGTLKSAMEQVIVPAASQQPKDSIDVEDMKTQMKDLLENACGSGQLHIAVQEIMRDEKQDSSQEATNASMELPATEPSIGVMKGRMRELLEVSCASGELTKALRSMQKGPESLGQQKETESPGQQVGDLKTQMRDLLENSAESGDLKQALTTVAQAKKSTEVDDMRGRMRGLLENACNSGELQGVLAKAKSSKQKQGDDELAPDVEACADAVVSPLAPVPPSSAKPAGQARPQSGVAALRQAERPKAEVEQTLSQDQLSNGFLELKEDNQHLHSQVNELTQAMEDLKNENKKLLENLQRKRPESAR